MLARIVFTSSYGASSELTLCVSIVSTLSSKATLAPNTPSTRAKVCVSRSLGTLRSRWTPGVSSVAAITGSAAFFEPEIRTVPSSGFPPRTSSLSTGAPLLRRDSLHRQCVDFLAHALAQCGIDELVTLHAAPALEFLRHDHRLEMLSVADHLDVLAREAGLDSCFDAFSGYHVTLEACSPISGARAPTPTAQPSLPPRRRDSPAAQSRRCRRSRRGRRRSCRRTDSGATTPARTAAANGSNRTRRRGKSMAGL